jgi:hypothetical protein
MDEKKKRLHVQELENTVAQFTELSRQFSNQKKAGINYLGAVVDNTAASVVSAYNALSDNPKRIVFTHHSNWFNYMGTVHRNFFTNLLAHTEQGVKEFCQQHSLSVSDKRERFLKQINKTFGESPRSDRQLKKLVSFVDASPEFSDYITAATSILGQERKSYWRRKFDALNVLRNKSSHSNSELTATQISKLIHGGFGAQVGGEGILMNTRLYQPLILEIVDFFKELDEAAID